MLEEVMLLVTVHDRICYVCHDLRTKGTVFCVTTHSAWKLSSVRDSCYLIKGQRLEYMYTGNGHSKVCFLMWLLHMNVF